MHTKYIRAARKSWKETQHLIVFHVTVQTRKHNQCEERCMSYCGTPLDSDEREATLVPFCSPQLNAMPQRTTHHPNSKQTSAPSPHNILVWWHSIGRPFHCSPGIDSQSSSISLLEERVESRPCSEQESVIRNCNILPLF